MREREERLQAMLDWLEERIEETPTLLDMSRRIGYSPAYCSMLFHRATGTTIKRYMAGRRLALATLALRDTDERILDIAVRTGYSSQEALTRAFTAAYGLTPYAYRKAPRPVRLPVKRNVLFPQAVEKGEDTMQSTILTEPGVRFEYIPAHQYIAIREPGAAAYMDFWAHHDCDAVCGTIDSMSHVWDPVVAGHTAGWYHTENGKLGYTYGFGAPEGKRIEIPEGFSVRDYPGSYYLVFYHPAFDFQKDCAEVMRRVEELAWQYDPTRHGFHWNETTCQVYQRHLPETIGYEVLRPVKR